jgi:thiamine kinase-like enzyme
MLYFGPSGEKVTRYIRGAQTLSAGSFRDSDILRKAAQVFRVLHTCGGDTHVPFDVFDMAAGYETIIRNNSVPLFDHYDAVKEQVMKIRSYVGSDQIAAVPCHNDPLCENWVLDSDGKLYLIDWEYAGMNDGLWDLADVSIEAGFSDEQDRMLLQFYFDRNAEPEETVRFYANKLYLDFLWALWGKTRVPFDGETMEVYAQERYLRLRQNLGEFIRKFSLD